MKGLNGWVKDRVRKENINKVITFCVKKQVLHGKCILHVHGKRKESRIDKGQNIIKLKTFVGFDIGIERDAEIYR